MDEPKQALTKGADVLSPILMPRGFRFVFRDTGRGSGGEYAWGEFVRANRRLELHVGQNLGIVLYHIGDQSASHRWYMRELEVLSQCRYSGFTENAAESFRNLAHDLAFAEDFLSGAATVLKRAAAKEALEAGNRDQVLMTGYVGDIKKLEELRTRFHHKQYADVLALAASLRFPDRMTASEQGMVEIARERAGGRGRGNQ